MRVSVLKSAIITVLAIALFSWVEAAPPTNAMIDSYTVNNSTYVLFQRLSYDLSQCDYDSSPKPIEFSTLICTNKPAQESMDAELVVYKNEKYAERLAYDAEMSRQQSVKDSFTAMPHFKDAARKVLGVTNPDAWLRDNLASMSDADMNQKISEIQTENDSLVTTRAIELRIKTQVKYGKMADALSKNVYDLIAGYNITRGLTDAQIDTMETTFSAAMKALQNKRPKKAKVEIEKIAPDGIIVTQEMKDDALYLLKDI